MSAVADLLRLSPAESTRFSSVPQHLWGPRPATRCTGRTCTSANRGEDRLSELRGIPGLGLHDWDCPNLAGRSRYTNQRQFAIVELLFFCPFYRLRDWTLMNMNHQLLIGGQFGKDHSMAVCQQRRTWVDSLDRPAEVEGYPADVFRRSDGHHNVLP